MRKKILSLIIAAVMTVLLVVPVNADIIDDGYNGFATRLYTVVLGRTPDPVGLEYWGNRLRTRNISFADCARGFLFSQEFLAKNVSDTEYVTVLYRTFLDREPESAGLDYWTGRLASGSVNRDTVIEGFSNSAEFGELCRRYSSSSSASNGITVCIDPGHSGVVASGYVPLGPGSSDMKLADTSGTRGRFSGVAEYVLTMQIANQLRTELEARGYNVIMTRTDNSTPVDCVTRAQIGNNGADIMVRLHFDGLDNSSVSGAHSIVIAPNNPWNPQTYAGSARLGRCIIDSYCSATGIRNRGVSEQNNMTGNNWSTIPCVLLEMGFMTNQHDDLYMTNPANHSAMVNGIANGIDAYFAS